MARLTNLKSALAGTIYTALWLLSCSPGGGTEIPEGYVGTLYLKDGRVAARASVRIVKQDYLLGKSTSETKRDILRTTDDYGNIVLDDVLLEDGYYYIMGELGSLKSCADSVLFEGGVCAPITDTLRVTGSISGRVRLYYGHDPTETHILFGPHATYWLKDSSGAFTISDLAEGRYTVRFETKFDLYRAVDTTIIIKSGCDDTIREPIIIPPYTDPIEGFSYVIDTLMRSVTLKWNRITSSSFAGYQLSIRGWERQVSSSTVHFYIQVLLNDTAKTVYLTDSLEAYVRTLDVYGNPVGYPTEIISIGAVDMVSEQTVHTPQDSVRVAGWIFYKGNFHILRTSMYDMSDAAIDVISDSGTLVSTYPLNTINTNPVGIASYGDSLYVLNRKNDDTLCLHNVIMGQSSTCTTTMVLAGITAGGGSNVNMGFGIDADGIIYVANSLTTYALRFDGTIITRNDGLNPHFALNENYLYTHTNEFPDKICRLSIINEKITVVTRHVYDTYKILSDVTPQGFAANDNGIICCISSVNLFVFDEQETFKARTFIPEGGKVVSLSLTGDNRLYLLYSNRRISTMDLSGLIIGGEDD